MFTDRTVRSINWSMPVSCGFWEGFDLSEVHASVRRPSRAPLMLFSMAQAWHACEMASGPVRG
jgi:hypothetical protein